MVLELLRWLERMGGGAEDGENLGGEECLCSIISITHKTLKTDILLSIQTVFYVY